MKNLSLDGLGFDRPGQFLEQSSRYTIGHLLRKKARSTPDRPAVVGEDGSVRSYSELNQQANRLVHSLSNRGVGYGDSVAVLAENRLEYPELIYAAAKGGWIAGLMNWRQSRNEILHCLKLIDPGVVFVSEKHEEKVDWIRESEELNPTLVGLGIEGLDETYEPLLEGVSAQEPGSLNDVHPEDALCVVYTSGTTGLPKGAVISHRAYVHRAVAWNLSYNLGPDFVGWGPLFHMISSDPLFTVCLRGGTFYVVDGFKTELVVKRLQESRTRYVQIIPGVVDRILEYAEGTDWDPSAFPELERIGALADLLEPGKLKKLTELFDADYMNTFGSTEVGPQVLSNNTIPKGTRPTVEDLEKEEGPLCELKLVGDEGEEVPPGEYGELLVRGPTLFSGYIGNPDANRESFTENGWFRTGDMFVRTERGTYRFVDRDKYLIKSGGENIYPAEIERHLMEVEGVEEVCVVRAPDEKWGEVPRACVALADGHSMEPEDVLDHLEDQIARYKLPHYVEFVGLDEFARSESGKVIRDDFEDRDLDRATRVRNP